MPAITSLLTEAWTLIRERFGIYLSLALLCGIAGTFGASELIAALRGSDAAAVLSAVWTVPALRVVIAAAGAALFFIVSSALRRVRSDFRMTPDKILLLAFTLLTMGLIVDLGFAALIAPGIAIGVLISQTLFNVLLAEGASGLQEIPGRLRDGLAASVRMTKRRFVSTCGVVTLSLLILMIPFCGALLGTLVLMGMEPRTLIVTAPLLFLVFVYFECVRYALIARWYRRLYAEVSEAGGTNLPLREQFV